MAKVEYLSCVSICEGRWLKYRLLDNKDQVRVALLGVALCQRRRALQAYRRRWEIHFSRGLRGWSWLLEGRVAKRFFIGFIHSE